MHSVSDEAAAGQNKLLSWVSENYCGPRLSKTSKCCQLSLSDDGVEGPVSGVSGHGAGAASGFEAVGNGERRGTRAPAESYYQKKIKSEIQVPETYLQC